MSWNEIVAVILLGLGAFLSVTGGVGILRMPDFYSRLHPAGKSDTLGQFFLIGGLLFLLEWGPASAQWLPGAKLVIISILLFITAPTATHAITKAAWIDGLRPWTGGERNTPGGGPGDVEPPVEESSPSANQDGGAS